MLILFSLIIINSVSYYRIILLYHLRFLVSFVQFFSPQSAIPIMQGIYYLVVCVPYSHCVLYLIYMCILKFLYMCFMHVNVSGRSVLLFNI